MQWNSILLIQPEKYISTARKEGLGSKISRACLFRAWIRTRTRKLSYVIGSRVRPSLVRVVQIMFELNSETEPLHLTLTLSNSLSIITRLTAGR
jgi:hypothetical protein